MIKSYYNGLPTRIACDDETTCAFSNIANYCYFVGNEDMGNFIAQQRYTRIDDVMKNHSKYFVNPTKMTPFKVGMTLLRCVGHVKLCKIKDFESMIPGTDGQRMNEHMLVIVQSTAKNAYKHVIGIAGSYIIDGSFTHCIPFNKRNLDIVCSFNGKKNSPKFGKITLGCKIE